MRIFKAAIASMSLLAQHSVAFSTSTTKQIRPRFSVVSSSPSIRLYSASTGAKTESTPCDIPTDVTAPSLVARPKGASVLRSSVVTDIYGDYIPLDLPMKKGKSIVIFLRHMG